MAIEEKLEHMALSIHRMPFGGFAVRDNTYDARQGGVFSEQLFAGTYDQCVAFMRKRMGVDPVKPATEYHPAIGAAVEVLHADPVSDSGKTDDYDKLISRVARL